LRELLAQGRQADGRGVAVARIGDGFDGPGAHVLAGIEGQFAGGEIDHLDPAFLQGVGFAAHARGAWGTEAQRTLGQGKTDGRGFAACHFCTCENNRKTE